MRLFLEDHGALIEMTTPEAEDSKWPPATSHTRITPIASPDGWKAFLELLHHVDALALLRCHNVGKLWLTHLRAVILTRSRVSFNRQL